MPTAILISAILGMGGGGSVPDPSAVGDMVVATAGPVWSILPTGTNGQVFQIVGGVPTWAAAPSGSFTPGPLLSGPAGNINDTVARTPVLGDIVYATVAPVWDRLSGNTTTTKKFLTQTGTGVVSAAPGWNTIAQADLPVFTGDSGAGGVKGAVPAPAAGDAAAGKYLKADGTWAVTPADAVTSVFGRTGVVIAVDGDYNAFYLSLLTPQTITAVHTFQPGSAGVAPFAVGTNGTAVVTRLNADKLDGSDASAFAAVVHTHAAADIVSGQLAIARGGTGTDLSATGGSKQFLSQASAAANVTVRRLAVDDIPFSATDKLLGRSSSGAGDGEEIACTSFGRSLIDDADATAGRITLQVVIGTNVQAWDADLDAIAALTSAANKLPYATGAQAWAMTDLSAFGRTLIDDADAFAARATLGAVIGTNVQAWDADLDALAALASTGFAARTASNTWAQRSLDDGFRITWTNPAGVAGNPKAQVVPHIVALTDGSTVTMDASLIGDGGLFTLAIGGNRTLAMSNGVDGKRFTLEITQDGTGNRTLTGDSTIGFGADIADLTGATTTANKISYVQFIIRGSKARVLAINKGF